MCESITVLVAVTVMMVLMACPRAVGDEAPETSLGTKLINRFDNTLLGVQKNLYKGTKAVNTPAVKFTVDTVPHLVHIYALVQGVRLPPKVASFAKDAVGRLALVAGTTASDAFVLGSSVMTDIMRVSAAVMEAQNDIVKTVGHKGIFLAGEMFDSLVNVTGVGLEAAAVGLTSLGDTLLATAQANGAMSEASARLVTAIGSRLVGALDGVHRHSKLLSSSLLGKTAREGQAANLVSYMSTLNSAQKVFEDMVNADVSKDTNTNTQQQ